MTHTEDVIIRLLGGELRAVTVELQIDLPGIAKRLASQAYHNKSGTAVFANGSINARLTKGQRLGQ